ncbi:DUF2378 family protein [Hyalangium gracile]|uniref:DUF2378 family protein n=1 Tax=Hyalangium gracile TaxID=394092 RepID=UPI001CCEDE7E|nr:DUF2378 family protein [Hyalangium gracile]
MTASSQNEPVIFSQMFEALVMHAMRGKLDPEAMRSIEAAGVDLSRPLLVAYPLTVWYDTVWACAQILFPALPRTEAMYATGRKVADGYSHTTMGKALFAGLRKLGWQRALGQMARSLRTGGNFLASHANELPGGDLEITLEILPEFLPALGSHPGIDASFMRGFLDASAELIRGHDSPRFALTGTDQAARRATFLLKEKD